MLLGMRIISELPVNSFNIDFVSFLQVVYVQVMLLASANVVYLFCILDRIIII